MAVPEDADTSVRLKIPPHDLAHPTGGTGIRERLNKTRTAQSAAGRSP